MLTPTAIRLMLHEIQQQNPEEIIRLFDLMEHDELEEIYFSCSNGELIADIYYCAVYWLNKLNNMSKGDKPA